MKECVERVLHTDARVPVSTYRVQMHKDFTFADAQAIVGYLKQLGIGDFYSSPIFEARPNSMHGYDVTRHDRLNPELGGAEGFEFLGGAAAQGLGLLLDIVPNHMGVGNDSIWWQDVLENGHASQYSEYFDIDWKPLKAALRNKLLLPILGDQYGAELEAKHIQVSIEDGRPLIHYYDHTMPVAPRTVHLIFRPADGSPADTAVFSRTAATDRRTFRRMKPATTICGSSGGHSWRSCCPVAGCAPLRKCSR
jgi:(1->4)-alpha-D-glucan 1-alpha-D-glucosylmutase